MKKAQVVIGANFGDEGKGLVTDYLSAAVDGDAMVVRFNGGAQAGHTVTDASGKRHVFNHIGSGALTGAPTFLSSHFVVNPILFFRDLERLTQSFDIRPVVIADPACPVTTPYDMLINEMIEEARGKNRHGSVGVGFGETLERQLNPEFSLVLDDVRRPHFRARLEAIRTEWVPRRLAALGFPGLEKTREDLVMSNELMDRFMESCFSLFVCVRLGGIEIISKARNIIFEGAQGLLLDQDYGSFPHVTRSNTGLKNVVDLAQAAGIDHLDVHYLTRSYLTRHGAGPMENELPDKPYEGIVDETNIWNPWQQSLRFGHLDLASLADAIATDVRTYLPASIRAATSLGMTCLDQIDGDAIWLERGTLRKGSPEDLSRQAQRLTGMDGLLGSYGPTRSTIKVF